MFEHASIKWLKMAKFSVLQFYRLEAQHRSHSAKIKVRELLSFWRLWEESASVPFPSLRLFTFLYSWTASFIFRGRNIVLVVYSMERCSDFQDLFEHIIICSWIIKNNVSTLRSLTLITLAKYLYIKTTCILHQICITCKKEAESSQALISAEPPDGRSLDH